MFLPSARSGTPRGACWSAVARRHSREEKLLFLLFFFPSPAVVVVARSRRPGRDGPRRADDPRLTSPWHRSAGSAGAQPHLPLTAAAAAAAAADGT